MNDNKKFLLKSFDGLLPFVISSLPKETKDKYICSLVHDGLCSFDTESAKNLATLLVYTDDAKSKTPFSILIGICKYLNDLILMSKTNETSITKEIKHLNTILSLPSKTIIDKKIDFKIANLDVTNTIKNFIKSDYKYETCDKVLCLIHAIIFKLLSVKVSDLSISNALETLDKLNIIDNI